MYPHPREEALASVWLPDVGPAPRRGRRFGPASRNAKPSIDELTVALR